MAGSICLLVALLARLGSDSLADFHLCALLQAFISFVRRVSIVYEPFTDGPLANWATPLPGAEPGLRPRPPRNKTLKDIEAVPAKGYGSIDFLKTLEIRRHLPSAYIPKPCL